MAHVDRLKRHRPKEIGEVFKSSLFPSPELIERLRRLPQPNTQPTTLINMDPIGIATLSQGSPIRIVMSKGMSREEKKRVREAAKMDGSQIEIFEGGNVQRREISVLRTIDREFLDSRDAQKTFSEFLGIMTHDREDLLGTEYTDYVLGHGTTGEIDNPLNAHQLANLGLRQIKDYPDGQEDKLRTELVEFAKKALVEVKTVFDGLVEQSPHRNLQRDDTELVLMLALLSNFLRGGIFYGFRDGQSMSYEPRKIAFNLINKAREEEKK